MDSTKKIDSIPQFGGSFTQQEGLSEDSIQAAVAVMKTGRLHRYNTATPDELTETTLLEQEFARYQDVNYCLACASGGYALTIALLASGLKAGDRVLCNSFTLAPVPGAISKAGGQAVLVEIDENYRIDIDDLIHQAESSGARFLMLSHMRGHIADMDKIVSVCQRYELTLIEDCAHTMGAAWSGKKSGNFGHVACFSSQTYKHINSGEGGLLTTNDAEIMAKAVLYSGSYMFYEQHKAAPDAEVFAALAPQVPNMSGRMDNLRAAVLRPQLATLDQQVRRWNQRYALIAEQLSQSAPIRLPHRPQAEFYVGSSIQFSLPTFSALQIDALVSLCAEHGVVLKWFGRDTAQGYTSQYQHWAYVAPNNEPLAPLPRTDRVLSTLLDMRIPLSFSFEDCILVARIIVACLDVISLQDCSKFSSENPLKNPLKTQQEGAH